MGPTPKKKKKTNISLASDRKAERVGETFVLFFIFLLFHYQIYENLSARIRRDKNEKCSMRRGLRVSTRNTRFHREFR